MDSLSEGSFCIYNSDDKNGAEIVNDTLAVRYSYGTGISNDFSIGNINYDLSGTTFTIKFRGQEFFINTSLVGEFNAYNACAAFASAVLTGIEEGTAVKGIKNTPQVPGRFEVIGNEDKKVIIDYSHTADSLEKALRAIKEIVKDKRPVYTVFGCGGNRDKSKRPVMGKIASDMSNMVILTSDNPRNENPETIISEIEAGIAAGNFERIEDREQAIKYALKKSEDNAVILIAGKGHENYQEIKGVRTHFSDKEIAEKYLAE
jgi:UDP-N-acetylmuramoyl-L-alanyl-D-glutamate--2,6-diaminopimelate ligase